MERSSTHFDKYTKIWSGPRPQSFFDADCSIGKILFAFMRNHPSNLCQISDTDGTALTNGEAITFAIRIAQQLKALGLKQDDVVGVAGTNTTYLMPVVLGCLLNGTPFHAVSPWHDEDTLKHLFSITRPRIIFCDGLVYPRISIISRMFKSHVYTLKEHRLGIPRVEDLLEPTKAELYYVPEPLPLGGDQTVAILCTSGTTGLPKAVTITNAACLFDFGFVTGQDVLLSFSTIDWSAGMFQMLFSACHGSTRIITDRAYTPEYLLQLVEKYKVTLLTLVPQQVASLVKAPTLSKQRLATIRFISIGGGNCYVANVLKMQEYLLNGQISYGYALTETGGVSANMGVAKPSSVGRIVPGVRVKILDDAGRSLGHGETGEILLHNGKQWNGYYGNPNETKRMQDYQGWFHTGDMGYFDDENYLHIVERKNEMLRFHGAQYCPHELEQVIAELPDVIEACVFGLWNDVDGDPAAAAVVKIPGSRLSEMDIVEYVAKRLVVTHKQLHCGVFFLTELPKTGSGKVLRQQARDQALGKKWSDYGNGH
ncbi:4-coumarate--CoA ligase-like 7 [Drosophila guanche]|uniref:Blast:4-coumarate--CoA ligase 3 n=1 Tax=Drosophila guanche TaxID=7266 RepID=A0A3B0K6M7_DROGU|nr:4-coumarate--CoA ligase-like 7 [Drosophila guanche]SPP83720.1 blast:4-coumarate--CoA ligase 3 [Drosophila guanche]